MQTGFLLLAIGVHLLLLYSIFDIYYSSPIVHGARRFPIVSSDSSAQAPADRLVFFSADGLRARTFYAHPERSPFLHSLIHGGKAAWGISNSHVPTESRPGHVAMMAGFYEDVSAVTRGWKHNPVPFDSTFNQSARAFLWGSPDIVHLFSTNIGPHARAEVYATELEDFASKDAAQLDRWVFQRVEKFLNRGKQEPEVGRQLATKRAIFFLHLLGLDTNGHGKKPRSEAYLANIGTVDDGVRQITRLFGQHFGDNRTAFLFTADHGMTDWGSHGDGTDDEVETPFMAWGAGISDSSATAQLRLTLAQVDLAPLQAALLGIAIPTNSFGIVPIQLLGATSHRYRFQAAYANFKQMVEQLAIRRAERRAHSFRVFFSEFPTLHFDALVNIENEILRLAQLKRYEAAGKACLKWIPLVREALNYFHGYHRFSQGLAIGALFCAWNFVLYASLIGHYQHLSALKIYGPSPPFCIGLFLAAVLVWAQGLTIANYLYFLSPILLLSIGLNMLGIDSQKLGCTTRLLGSIPLGIRAKRVAAALIFTGLAISLLVCVFFERYILSLLFVVISPVWIIQLWQRSKNNDVQWCLGWLLLCLALATFPLMDTVGSVPRPLLVICAQALCCCALFFWTNRRQMPNAKMELTGFRVVHILHWVGLVLLVADVLMGPLQLMRIFAWLSLPLAFMIPFWPPTFFPTQSQNANNNNQQQQLINQRLLLWSASLQLPYSLLSLGQECLFLCLFSVLLFVYVQLDTDDILHDEEASFANKKKRNHLIRNFAFDEWLNALFLVICIEMAFFGTGNIASLNSFNPSFLRHFLSVFSPFTMAALLLLKVFIPFLLVSLHFVAASTGSRSQGEGGQARLARLSTLVALITNWMAMAFFYCLRTDGSWLQIGLSISNFVICLVCSAATHLLLHFAHCLLFLPDDTTKSQIIIRKSLALFDSYF